MKKRILGIVSLLVAQAGQAATAPNSWLPQRGLGELLATRFDLATIRSSLGRKRSAATNTFASLGLRPASVSDTGVVFDDGNWHRSMTVLRRGDFNRDGIEDLEVCFVDRAAPAYATYNAQKALLVTRYASDGNLVALAYAMEGCESFAR